MLKVRRKVALLLALVMLLSLINPCTTVHAQENTVAEQDVQITETTEASVTTSEEKKGEVTTEIATEVETSTEQSTEKVVSEQSTTEQITTEQTTQETVIGEEASSEAGVDTNATTEESTEITDTTEVDSLNESTETSEAPVTAEAIMEEKITNVKSDGVDDAYMIYCDGTWGTENYRWYVNVSGKKHYVFCLNHGQTMKHGLYYGKMTAGYSGYSAFRKAVALNYFYKLNGNSWNGNKGYGDVQYAIWDSDGTEISEKLLTYASHAWRVTSLNSARAGDNASSYSTLLKGIKKSEQEDKTAIKTMISELTQPKHIIDMSSAWDAKSSSFKDTILLYGNAWKYFNNGGFDGGASDIVVDGVYNTDGSKITDGSCSASIDSAGNLSVNFKNTDTMGKTAASAYTIIMHISMDYKGAKSLNYLLTADGKQNLTYNADFSSSAYFAVRVYGDTEREGAKLYINKVDEFDNFVPGCTFQLTGVSGDALTNADKVNSPWTFNSPGDYFAIKYPGYYKLVETQVPSSVYKLDTTEHYVYAEYNDDNKLLLYEATKKADGTYSYGEGRYSKHVGNGTASFSYYFPNNYESGAATLTKYAKALIKYENGQFVYEQRTLDDVGFKFYAAEDIYINDNLIFSKGQEIHGGTKWGGTEQETSGATVVKHTVRIDGKIETILNGMGVIKKYYTANGGKLTISDLPTGSYYCVESDLSHPGLVIAVDRYYFDVTAGQTESINGLEGIINTQAPADVCVYKIDENTKEYLSGAEFTVYANINNTNYDGQKLFDVSQTVEVVTKRDLVTGKETVESNIWIPIQTVVSNSEGLALFNNLPYGDYLIAEAKAPEGYELPEKTIRFTHSLPDTGLANNASGFVFEYEIGNISTSDFTIYKKAEKAYLNTVTEKNVDAYVYKDEAIEGAVFGIYADSEIKNTLGEVVFNQGDLVTKCTTNKEGIAQFGGAMFVGKYYFQEIQTADDSIYELDDTKHYFEVTGKENIRTLTDEAILNRQMKGSIKVIKTDGVTKVALSRVEFNLLDASKQMIGTYVTDDNGELFIKNLPVGTYYLQEAKAKENYKLDDTVREVTISKEKLDHELAIVNEEYKGSIKVIKTDGKTKVALSGVEFKLFDSTQTNVLGTYITDDKGEIFIGGLSIGTYYLQETKTLENYKLDESLREVIISKDNLNREVSITNDRYKGSIKIIKTDGKTKVALSDVEFILFDSDKNELGTYKTDENGEILIDNLEVGTYYLQETKTQKGYKLDDKMVEVVISVDDLHKQVEMKNYRNETKITIKTDTTYSGSGEVRTGDMSPVAFMWLLFFMSSFGLAYSGKRNNWKVSLKAKKFVLAIVLSVGVVFLGGLTVRATAELKELCDVEYNGKIYTYALQKEYETSDQEEKIAFDEKVNGMKLADVQYETLDTILQKKTLEETKDYKDLIVKDEDKIAKTITLDGNVYELQDITWSQVPNMESVNYTVDYGFQTAEPKPDATYEYTYTSPVMKEENTVSLPFVRLDKGNEDWVDGFSATVTFHNIDGLYFNIGNHEITYDANKLSLSESDYKELVKMLGYDTSKYRLNRISWSGKEYKKNNVTCRDAKATGQQYAASYKAYYEDEVENGKIYTAHATYACDVEVPADEAAPTYVMRATAYYEKPGISPVVTAVGVVIAVVLVIAILYVLSRKKKNVSSSSING